MPIRKHKELRTGAIVIVFCALIALLLAPLNHESGEFFAGLVHSECIGLSIFGVFQLVEATLFRQRKHNLRHLANAVLAVPIGYVSGTAIAATLLGEHELAAQLLRTPPFEIGITFAASICIIYFFWSRERLHAETTAHARAQQLALEAQLKLLQTQIEPHMLFNTLSTLHTLIEIDPPRAQTMVDQLITYLRSTLAASRAERISLQHEFDQLRAYLHLMSLRMGTRLSFQLELPDTLHAAQIPPMLLQPLVENAIKHGLEPKVEGGSITVSARAAAGRLVLQVRDTGLGLQGAALQHGYGLMHVRERLQALYGVQATLEMDSRCQAGFAVSIGLPLTLPVTPS